MGTSDSLTVGVTDLFVQTPGQENMIMINPVSQGTYLTILYNKNGSLTRECMKDEKYGGT